MKLTAELHSDSGQCAWRNCDVTNRCVISKPAMQRSLYRHQRQKGGRRHSTEQCSTSSWSNDEKSERISRAAGECSARTTLVTRWGCVALWSHLKWKKALGGDANTALAAVRRSQNFRPTTDPLPGGAGWPKFNQLETVTTFTYKPSLVRIDARNFELSW